MTHIDLAEKWIKKAESDLIAATHMFKHVHPKQFEISCYHSQQAVEKALKGYLVYRNDNPPHTHDLAVICNRCAELDTSFLEYIDICAALSEYATRTRYPDDFDIEEDETIQAINNAYEVYDFVLNYLPELACKYKFADTLDEELDQSGIIFR